MNSIFWQKTIWYLLLALITAVMLVIFFCQVEKPQIHRRVLAGRAGRNIRAGGFLLLLTDAYSYYPGLTPDRF